MPRTIDTTASLSSLVVRSRSGICEENISSSSWVFNVIDIFYRFKFVAKVCLCRGMAKDTEKAGRSPSMGASGAGSDRWAIFSPTCGTGGLKPRVQCTRSAP